MFLPEGNTCWKTGILCLKGEIKEHSTTWSLYFLICYATKVTKAKKSQYHHTSNMYCWDHLKEREEGLMLMPL